MAHGRWSLVTGLLALAGLLAVPNLAFSASFGDPPEGDAEAAKTANDKAPQQDTGQAEKKGKPDSDQEREALIQMIRARAEAAKRDAKDADRPRIIKPTTRPAGQIPTVQARPGVMTLRPQSGQPGAAADAQKKPGEKANEGADCHATSSLDLTPPAEDQPQPKFICTKTKDTAEPVWQGAKVVFKFEIANGGEAPLNIRLKGG